MLGMVNILSLSCDHVTKVLEWGVDQKSGDFHIALWGCTNCDETFTVLPDKPAEEKVEHVFDCECFGCKARSIRVAYSGIGGGDATTQKKWDKNLDLYRAARAQGIEPVGTKPSQVMAAIKQSEKTGTAFKAS